MSVPTMTTTAKSCAPTWIRQLTTAANSERLGRLSVLKIASTGLGWRNEGERPQRTAASNRTPHRVLRWLYKNKREKTFHGHEREHAHPIGESLRFNAPETLLPIA